MTVSDRGRPPGLHTEAERESIRTLSNEIAHTRHLISEGIRRVPSEMRDLYTASAHSSMEDILSACDVFLSGEKAVVDKSWQVSGLDMLGKPCLFFKGSPFSSRLWLTPIDIALIQEVMDPEQSDKHEPSIIWQFRPNGHFYAVQYYFRSRQFHNFAIRAADFAEIPGVADYHNHFPLKLDVEGKVFGGQTICLREAWAHQVIEVISNVRTLLDTVIDAEGYMIPEYSRIKQLEQLSSPDWWKQKKEWYHAI